jgi:hypothetical protein
MGYQSIVAYKIKFNDKDRFNAFVIEAKLDPHTQRCFEEENMKWNGFEVNEEHLELRLFAEWVKWYDDYEDVKCHMKLLDKATTHNELSKEDKNGDVCWWIYRRIGESEDDLETRYEGHECDWSAVGLNRSIVVDWA